MEAPHWEPVRKLRAYEQVLDRIEERIREGHLRPGDRLPPERDLGEMLGVGRPAVREALRVLEAFGIVEARTGRGDDAGSRIVQRSDAALTRLLRLHLGLSGFSIPEVLETRIMLETWAVSAAAVRRTDADIDALSVTLDAMQEPGLPATAFSALDTEFHVRMTAASGNRLTARWMQALRGAIEREMAAAHADLDVPRAAITRRLQDEHRRILDHIIDRDPAGAADAVRDHIRGFYDDHFADSDAFLPSSPTPERGAVAATASPSPAEPVPR